MYIIDKVKNYSYISLSIAIISCFLWIVPVAGYILSTSAIFLGYKSIELEDNYGAIAGMCLGIISLLLTLLRTGLVHLYG